MHSPRLSRWSRLATLVVVTGLGARAVGAQQTASPPVPASTAVLPTVALPPALDRVLRDYERAWRARDVDGLVALFTSDGTVMQPGRPAVRGAANIASVYRGQGGSPLRLRSFAYGAADSVGYILGAYGYGEGTSEMGKFTLTLRRASNGKWLIASDMDNGNQTR